MATASTDTYRFGDFTLDNSTRSLTDGSGHTLTLSSRAFDTLQALVEHHGRTLSKKQLMSLVWPDIIVEENNLNQAISSLRKVLGDSKNQSRFIKTVPGRGYCFVAPVTTVEEKVTEQTPAAPETGISQEDITPPQAGSSEDEQSRPVTDSRSPLLQWGLAAGLVLATAAVLGSVFMIGDRNSDTASLTTGANLEPVGVVDREPESRIANSIVVLPFSILNPEAMDDTLFATGLHDEIINQLSKVGSLNVISRSSVLALAGRQDSEAIARRYGVESVITGNILYAGEKARISLQMADAVSGVTLWADSYETETHNLANMISIQSDIANNVATALQAKIKDTEQSSIASLPTESFEAYRYLLGARDAYFEQDFVTAWDLTLLALEHDPGYLDANYMFSSLNVVLTGAPILDMSSREHYELAMEYANRLISWQPDLPEGYILRAAAMTTAQDWLGVARDLDFLESINTPPAKLNLLGSYFMSVGDFDRAIEVYEAGLVTEPVNLFSRGFLVAALEMSGRREEAREEFVIGEELRPMWWGDTMNVFLALGRNEQLGDREFFNTLPERVRNALDSHGDSELVNSYINDFLASDRQTAAEALYFAALAADIQSHDKAIDLMRIALEDIWLSFYFLWLPVFDETRQTASFRSLLMDSGLVDYWNVRGWPAMCSPSAEGITCDWRAFPGESASL